MRMAFWGQLSLARASGAAIARPAPISARPAWRREIEVVMGNLRRGWVGSEWIDHERVDHAGVEHDASVRYFPSSLMRFQHIVIYPGSKDIGLAGVHGA